MWNSHSYGYPYPYQDASHHNEQDDIQEMMSRLDLDVPQEQLANPTSYDSGEIGNSYQNPLISELGGVSFADNTAAPPPYPPLPSFTGYGFYPPPLPPYLPYFLSETANSSPEGSTLDIVTGRGENGCAVSAIACALGKTYDEVRPHAVASGFTSEDGMDFRQMKNTIKALGYKAKIRYADEWAEVADLAIVSIRNSSGDLHAVVFERNEAGRFIYDSNNAAPVYRDDDLALAERRYLKIIKD